MGRFHLSSLLVVLVASAAVMALLSPGGGETARILFPSGVELSPRVRQAAVGLSLQFRPSITVGGVGLGMTREEIRILKWGVKDADGPPQGEETFSSRSHSERRKFDRFGYLDFVLVTYDDQGRAVTIEGPTLELAGVEIAATDDPAPFDFPPVPPRRRSVEEYLGPPSRQEGNSRFHDSYHLETGHMDEGLLWFTLRSDGPAESWPGRKARRARSKPG